MKRWPQTIKGSDYSNLELLHRLDLQNSDRISPNKNKTHIIKVGQKTKSYLCFSNLEKVTGLLSFYNIYTLKLSVCRRGKPTIGNDVARGESPEEFHYSRG